MQFDYNNTKKIDVSRKKRYTVYRIKILEKNTHDVQKAVEYYVHNSYDVFHNNFFVQKFNLK